MGESGEVQAGGQAGLHGPQWTLGFIPGPGEVKGEWLLYFFQIDICLGGGGGRPGQGGSSGGLGKWLDPGQVTTEREGAS